MATLTNVSVSCSQKYVEETVDGKQKKVLKPCDKLEGIVPYSLPESLAEAGTMFSEAVALSLLNQKLVIFVQDTWRRNVAAGTDLVKATELAATAKPGMPTPRAPIDPQAAAKAAMSGMSPEERKAFIASLAQLAKAMA